MEASGGIGGEEGGVGGEESEAELVKELVFDGFDSQLGPPTNTQNHTYTHTHTHTDPHIPLSHTQAQKHTHLKFQMGPFCQIMQKNSRIHTSMDRERETHTYTYTHKHTYTWALTYSHTHTRTHVGAHTHARAHTHPDFFQYRSGPCSFSLERWGAGVEYHFQEI